MKTLFLLVSIWTMSFVAVSFAGQKKTSLTEVYCNFVLSEKNIVNLDGVTLGTFDERWETFISYLENREVLFKVSEETIQWQELEACILSNKEKFEIGEFSLLGLKSVEETKSLLAKVELSSAAPTLIAGNINLLDREISTPDMEVVYGFLPEGKSEVITTDLLETGISERQERYAALWKEFTLNLKEYYLLQQSGLPVLTSELK